MNFLPAIQLYTVKNILHEDFEGTIDALAAMGYKAVEFAWNYGSKRPDELAAFLDSRGLKVCGLHLRIDDLLNPTGDGYAYARATGASFVTTSAAGDVQKDWRATIRSIAQGAAVARDQGCEFTYHNHAPEFDCLDGRMALDTLYAETDPELVKAEIDVGFAFQRGVNPADLIRRYGSRVKQVHLRDLPDGGDEFVELGNGAIDLRAVLSAARDAGTKWAIVEQSVCEDELESARISLATLQRLQNESDGPSCGSV